MTVAQSEEIYKAIIIESGSLIGARILEIVHDKSEQKIKEFVFAFNQKHCPSINDKSIMFPDRYTFALYAGKG